MRVVLFTLSSILFLTSPAVAGGSRIGDVFCDSREGLRDRLTKEYGAELQGRGVRSPDAILEIWSEPLTGGWTLVQSYSDGRSCIVAMGEAWELVVPDHDPA